MRSERHVRRCGSAPHWRPGSLLVRRTVSTSWLYLLLDEGAEPGQCFYNMLLFCEGHWELVHESHQLMDANFATFLKGEFAHVCYS